MIVTSSPDRATLEVATATSRGSDVDNSWLDASRQMLSRGDDTHEKRHDRTKKIHIRPFRSGHTACTHQDDIQSR